MAPPWWADHQLMLEYVKDLRTRVPVATAHRRFRAVRAFSRFLAPRRLDQAGVEDVAEWSLAQRDEQKRAVRRADLADFLDWKEARQPVPTPTAAGGGERPHNVPVTTEAPPPASEPDAEGGPPPAVKRRRRGKTPPKLSRRQRRENLAKAGATTRRSRRSLPVRIATALVLVGVCVLWMVLLVVPNWGSQTTTTTSTLPERRPGLSATTVSTATTVAVRPRSEVVVLVVNATGVTGRANELAEKLEGAGYRIVPPSPGSGRPPTSTVYWTPGWEREAQALAAAIQVPTPIAVAPLPDPPPAPLAGANVVVVLGQDLAR